MGKAFPLAILSGVLLLVSCDKKMVYDNYVSYPNYWERDSVAAFKFMAPDTVQPYNLFINLRNTSEYNYNNLFLITKMTFPNGKVIGDTLEYRMATPSGEWLGTGFGEVKENKLWYKENIKFTEDGEYQLTIQQAMRKGGETEGVDSLEGITEVGFRIENTYNIE